MTATTHKPKTRRGICPVCGQEFAYKDNGKGGKPRTYCLRIVEPVYARNEDGSIKTVGRRKLIKYDKGRPAYSVREAAFKGNGRRETSTCEEIAKLEQRFQSYFWKLTYLVEQDEQTSKPSEKGRRRLQEFKTGLFAMLSEVVARSGPLVRSRFRGDRIGWKIEGGVKPGHLPPDET